jgi:hypothetical protein
VNTNARSELDEIEMERKVAGGILQQFTSRASKKNHEGMVQLAKEVTDIFTKHGEYFQLGNTGDMVVFTNIAKTASSSQDKEDCLERFFFRDNKHKEEYIPKCASDDKIGATLQTIHLPDGSRFSHNE